MFTGSRQNIFTKLIAITRFGTRCLFITLAICCFLVGCRKIKHYAISSKILKDAVSFKPGTFYIYQDSLSSQTDSFWVDNREENGSYSNDETYTYDWMSYTMRDTLGHKFSFYTAGNKQKVKQVIGSHNGYASIWLTDPFKVGNTINNVSGSFNCIGHHSSLLIKGVSYNNVYVVTGSAFKNGSREDVITTYYSPEIGLLKIDIATDSTHRIMEIIRFNIVR